MAQSLKCLQAELRAANMTWNFYAYGRTVHAFTLMENPVWNGSKSVVSQPGCKGCYALCMPEHAFGEVHLLALTSCYAE